MTVTAAVTGGPCHSHHPCHSEWRHTGHLGLARRSQELPTAPVNDTHTCTMQTMSRKNDFESTPGNALLAGQVCALSLPVQAEHGCYFDTQLTLATSRCQ
jgi:hypothetical protein